MAFVGFFDGMGLSQFGVCLGEFDQFSEVLLEDGDFGFGHVFHADQPVAGSFDGRHEFIEFQVNGLRVLVLAAQMRKTIRNVTMVVPVLMTSCQVSENPKKGPLISQTTMMKQAIPKAGDEPDHLVAMPENLARYDSRMRLSLFALAIIVNDWMIGYMTIELTDDELQEIVKALETVRRLHDCARTSCA